MAFKLTNALIDKLILCVFDTPFHLTGTPALLPVLEFEMVKVKENNALHAGLDTERRKRL